MTEFAIVDPDEVPNETFTTGDTDVRKLTEPLGCDEMRVNLVTLEPGEVTRPHTHDGQEEVFVALTDAEIRIDDTRYDVPEGHVVRVAPETVRNLLNTGSDSRHRWLALGAPPVGTVENFGAYVLDGNGETR